MFWRAQTLTLANGKVRIAIVGTPRSGNTWLRWMLSQLIDGDQFAVNGIDEIDWKRLPANLVLQMHCRATHSYQDLLQQYGFRPVVLARHPLDVLLSILQYAQQNVHRTTRWIDGEAGNELALIGAKPCSPEFEEYATGPRSVALLAVSREWSLLPQCRCVKYDQLVADTKAELTQLCRWLGVAPCRSISDVIEEHRIEDLRSRKNNNHFWQGQPGHWKKLIPAPLAHKIAAAHAETLATFGYTVDPDECLSVEEATWNWYGKLAKQNWLHNQLRSVVRSTKGILYLPKKRAA
ncbi:MAG: sulfotransferase [Planctomycetales bacterium]|nr:sulfotransferase [Planctomycetales bacterium]